MNTFQVLQRFLAERFALALHEVTPDCTLQSLGIDSLAALELLFDLDERFGIRLPDEAQQAATLGELVALIDRQLARPLPQAA